MQELATAPIDFANVESGEELSWLRPGMRSRVLTRLRRGHWRVQDEIDLHEMNTKAASASIRSFLADARRDGLSCVKIIHGKGLPFRPRRTPPETDDRTIAQPCRHRLRVCIRSPELMVAPVPSTSC